MMSSQEDASLEKSAVETGSGGKSEKFPPGSDFRRKKRTFKSCCEQQEQKVEAPGSRKGTKQELLS